MAFIKERNGIKGKSYQVRYRINGKVKVKTFSPADNTKKADDEAKRQAKKFAKDIEAQKTLGIAKDESSMTFNEYSEKVFKKHDRKASSQTKESRKYNLRIVNDNIGHIKLKDMTATKIENFFVDMSESKSDQVLSKYKQIINIVMESAFRKDLIVINPMLKVDFDISQQNIKEVKAIDVEVFNKYIYHAMESMKYYYPILLMYFTGMRVGEVLAIKRTDFDFDRLKFYVNKNLRRDMTIGPVKKGRNRTGPIHEELSELFYEIITWQEYNKNNFGAAYKDNGLLICDYDGSPITYRALHSFLRKLDKLVGVKIRPHQLRHTFATLMNEMGVNPKEVQQLLGHKKITTTMNVYQHLTNNLQSDTIQKVGTIFKDVKPIQNRYKK